MAGTAQPAATHADAWLDNDRLRLHQHVTAQQYLHLNDRYICLRRQQIADHALISQLRKQVARLQQTQRQLEPSSVCVYDSVPTVTLTPLQLQRWQWHACKPPGAGTSHGAAVAYSSALRA